MILICSDVKEASTDIVCSWLNFYKKKFIRISKENVIKINCVFINNNGSDIEFDIDDNTFKLSQFTSYWYRRSRLNFKRLEKVKFIFEETDLSEEVAFFLKDEYEKVLDFFEIKLSEISKLNKFKDNQLNKLNTLHQAGKLGICIPNTLISDNFNDKISFNDKWITKPVSDLIMKRGQINYYSSTKRVTQDDIDNIEISLIQSEINKRFEIRSFFFNNEFYSSVIFSQENPKTELDFRNYDTENPNRVVPFKLPNEIEDKLRELCIKLDLNSGSFDIAYTDDNEYVLFEVNPVGQFEQVSFPCNYQIHKKIAEFL